MSTPVTTLRKIMYTCFTFKLCAMSAPLTGEARSLAQLQADIRVRLVIRGVNSYWPLSLSPSLPQ